MSKNKKAPSKIYFTADTHFGHLFGGSINTLMKHLYSCPMCKCSFLRYSSAVIVTNPCCSRICQSRRMEITLMRENNPNYGNKWSEEQKQIQRQLIIKKYNEIDGYRESVGNSNRGKKFSKERVKRMHGHRQASSYSHPHTKETKEVIGKKSKEKFNNPNYQKKVRKTNVDNGNWIPFSQKSDYEIYFILSNWTERMFYELSDIETARLAMLGIFNSKTNVGGLVRDHVLSRKDGFVLGIPPAILRHPCNCQLLTVSENVTKGSKSLLTTEELFDKIKIYDGHWKEHSLCCDLISRYESGEKFCVNR